MGVGQIAFVSSCLVYACHGWRMQRWAEGSWKTRFGKSRDIWKVIHSKRLALQATRQDVLAAAVASALLTASRAPAADRSLTDSEGRFVVDPRKAAAGLEDPVVEPDGAYSTISAALAVAPPGSTIIVRPGVYNERLTITRPVRLIADSNAVVTWKTDKPYESVLTIALNDTVGDVFVSGLTVRHSSKSVAQNYGVFVPEPSRALDKARIELRACDITSFSGTGIGVEGGNVTISKCQVSNCKNQGIVYAGPTSRGSIVGCVVEKCQLNGVLLRDGASPTLEANTLRKNGLYGASLFDCRGTFLDSNDASGNGKGAISGVCDGYSDDI